jgi:hypothetical protein
MDSEETLPCDDALSFSLSSSRRFICRDMTHKIPQAEYTLEMSDGSTFIGRCFGPLPGQSDKSITARSAILSRSHNVFNVNLVEFPVEFSSSFNSLVDALNAKFST